MNISNQLLLGLVFITAGVALALLAYAAILNRRPAEVDERDDGEPGAASEDVPPGDEDKPAPTFSVETEAEAATIIAEPKVEPSPASAVEPTVMVSAIPAAPQKNAPESPTPPVSIERDPAGKKLMIRVEGKPYRSMSELKNSEAWEDIGDLFEQLMEWMIVVPPHAPTPPAQTGSGSSKAESRSHSMVEQINEILSEKLARAENVPQAVHLSEGPGGSIRVYIGVNGYSIQDVPNAEVRRLIREAVEEWESRP